MKWYRMKVLIDLQVPTSEDAKKRLDAILGPHLGYKILEVIDM